MNKCLAIYNGKNRWYRNRFWRDGAEFQREALAWSLAQPEPVELVDVRDGRVRREIRKMKNGLDVLAIFDHGSPRGLPRMRENLGNIRGLAAAISSVTDQITIILYSCSCGRGWWGRWGFRRLNKRNKKNAVVSIGGYSPRDGYAIALTCELERLGVDAEVFAHLTRGHCCQNPHVVGVSSIRGWRVWRTRVVSPGTPKWRRWKANMKGEKRFTFWHGDVVASGDV